MKPLADRIRPDSLDMIIGQKHLVGEGKILRNLIEKKECVNMIFYGPSGVGKTTIANILANNMNKTLYKLNATTAGTKDIKDIAKELDTLQGANGIILYLDEIQNFNKKQQQALLEYVESGDITLIASTTENPYFYIYGALLSRCLVFEFNKITPEEIAEYILKRQDDLGYKIDENAAKQISILSGGDVRRALNILDAAIINQSKEVIDCDDIALLNQGKYMDYDKFGNSHYDYLSCFQKSIRGSDPDAAIHYLARLVMSGDLISIIRRLLVIACEDIGMAHPQAITVVKACTDAAKEIGFPEARIPLAQAVIYLATLPKSNSGEMAIDAALSDLEKMDVGDIPKYIRDPHTSTVKSKESYKFPHNYPNHWVKQQYLPENIKDAKYYDYGLNKYEQGLKQYWDQIKK
ncbi:MAG: replication-associated recombination protein A [Clostridia bacterium]|nr:replication-associated recombination protein A [Clostridia bacterium]